MTSQETKFLQQIKKACQEQQKTNKILSSVTAAQAIYESNWGTADYIKSTNNLFRVLVDKDWNGACYSLETGQLYTSKHDCVDKTETLIKAYESYTQCIKDWIGFVTTVRRSEGGPLKYQNVIGVTDYKKCIANYIRDGYIKDHLYSYNDPAYESTLISLIEKYRLYKWDDVSKVDIHITKYFVKMDADKEVMFSDTVKENAIKMAKDNRGYKVYDDKSNLIYDPWIVDESNPMYRVRLEWDQPNTQLIGTKILIDAKEMAEAHTGYKVFEGDDGTMIYNPWEKTEDPEDKEDLKKAIILQAGAVVNLNNEPIYRHAGDKNPFIFLNGKFYLYDDKNMDGFVRITKTNSLKRINGKDPSVIIGFMKIK